MERLKYEIKQIIFKLRYTGDGPAFLIRSINLITISPDTIPGVWAFLFSVFSQVFEAGPFWTVKLGYQNKQGKCHTATPLYPFKNGLSFPWLKIWSNISRVWKHSRTGLVNLPKIIGAVGQVYRI